MANDPTEVIISLDAQGGPYLQPSYTPNQTSQAGAGKADPALVEATLRQARALESIAANGRQQGQSSAAQDPSNRALAEILQEVRAGRTTGYVPAEKEWYGLSKTKEEILAAQGIRVTSSARFTRRGKLIKTEEGTQALTEGFWEELARTKDYSEQYGPPLPSSMKYRKPLTREEWESIKPMFNEEGLRDLASEELPGRTVRVEERISAQRKRKPRSAGGSSHSDRANSKRNTQPRLAGAVNSLVNSLVGKIPGGGDAIGMLSGVTSRAVALSAGGTGAAGIAGAAGIGLLTAAATATGAGIVYGALPGIQTFFRGREQFRESEIEYGKLAALGRNLRGEGVPGSVLGFMGIKRRDDVGIALNPYNSLAPLGQQGSIDRFREFADFMANSQDNPYYRNLLQQTESILSSGTLRKREHLWKQQADRQEGLRWMTGDLARPFDPESDYPNPFGDRSLVDENELERYGPLSLLPGTLRARGVNPRARMSLPKTMMGFHRPPIEGERSSEGFKHRDRRKFGDRSRRGKALRPMSAEAEKKLDDFQSKFQKTDDSSPKDNFQDEDRGQQFIQPTPRATP